MTELREPPLLSNEETQKILNDWFLRQPEPYPAYNPDLYETLAQAQRLSDIKWMKEHCYLKAERELLIGQQKGAFDPYAEINLLNQYIDDMLKEVDGIAYRACKEFKD